MMLNGSQWLGGQEPVADRMDRLGWAHTEGSLDQLGNCHRD